jgi:hypothetical protein
MDGLASECAEQNMAFSSEAAKFQSMQVVSTVTEL